jgi:ATP adenylyltransferase/5',5'''-P-1,P-4-tetraphosphate phosphorylase II
MNLEEKFFYIPDERDNISFLTEQLFKQQIQDWKTSADNYNGLKDTMTRIIEIDGMCVKIQFNPNRMRSSAAKIDAKSLSERKCFLCWQNLPDEQMGIPVFGDFMILVNPYPIFDKHLTIPKINHTDQLILNSVETMLNLAAALNDYVIFYNGQKCGASAPDHLHFQAGNKGFLPVEIEFEQLKNSLPVKTYKNVKISFAPNYLRRMITLQSNNKSELLETFDNLYNIFATQQPDEPEPMLNIICYTTCDEWIMHIFPRIKHRPSQFFAKDDEQILISPASVDFGGVFITPRFEDFEKIKAEDIIDIFNQITINQNNFDTIMNNITETK